ncbi:MAG: S53 family peptidase [Nocardioidaceae bacterium]|nr:S53 family peptidase [Nocardioidaceae bacterium]
MSTLLMSSRLSTPRRRGVRAALGVAAAVTTTAGLVLPLPPSQAASTPAAAETAAVPVTSGGAAPRVDRVTLVSGDTVLLRSGGPGPDVATMTAGSPHAGRPVRTARFGGDSYVVPRLPAAELAVIDPSAFNVSALAAAARAGTAPLTVTFAEGAAVRDLPGLRLDRGSAAKRADGTTTLAARISTPGALSGLAGSLRGVERISGPVPSVTTAPGDFEMHTVTIRAERSPGQPLPFAMLAFMNVDDGRQAAGFAFLLDGEWKVSLPSGHYWLMSDDFNRAVVREVDVTSDTSVDLVMSEATVRPSMSLAGQHALDRGVTLLRQDALGRASFSMGYSGTTPRLTPVAPPPSSLGTFVTTVEYTFGAPGTSLFDEQVGHLAMARKARRGIPSDLSFSFRPADFARMDVRSFATGASEPTYGLYFGLVPEDTFVFIWAVPVQRPGTMSFWALGDSRLRWLTEQATGRRGEQVQFQLRSFKPGPAPDIDFFRGPVGPGPDIGSDGDAVGPRCTLCADHGTFHGQLSFLSSSGTAMTGLDVARNSSTWTMSSRGQRVASGQSVVVGTVPESALGKRATLTMTHRASARWQVSTRVEDTWSFTFPAGRRTIPILRASYRLPMNLTSGIHGGPVSFPIRFDALGSASSRVHTATVEWSTNGKQWHRAALRRLDATSFRVGYRSPSAGKTVSLRIHAADAAGRTVDELAEDAYAVGRGVAARRAATPTVTRPTRTGSSLARSRTPYRPHRVCRTAGVHRDSCFTRVERYHVGPTPKAADPAGWGATDLRQAYDVPGTGSTATVGIVVAYDYPKAEADMNAYRKQFGLPPCTSASGCFTKLNQQGEADNYPRPDMNWGVEAALDLQMVSAACPTCQIVLVEANQPTTGPLRKATQAAAAAGATVVNHSYGIQEYTGVEIPAAAYDVPGVTSVVASGDSGFTNATFPASVPGVVAVGGTSLSHADNARGWSERAWLFGGSGCSAYFAKPAWQSDPACHMRTFADMAAVADELAIYDTFLPKRYRGWLRVGGTSASSPFTAGLIGAADAGGLKPGDLYGRTDTFNDITTGRNGACSGSYLCKATAGFDGPTGWGTPQGIAPFVAP